MTRQPVQRTRFQALLTQLADGVVGRVRRGWRAGSLALLALLGGFFLAQNLFTLWMIHLPGGRPMAALGLVLAVELMIRIRSRVVEGEPPTGWVVADNLRVGVIYSVVLESFKVGT
jgi:hypothetical protein